MRRRRRGRHRSAPARAPTGRVRSRGVWRNVRSGAARAAPGRASRRVPPRHEGQQRELQLGLLEAEGVPWHYHVVLSVLPSEPTIVELIMAVAGAMKGAFERTTRKIVLGVLPCRASRLVMITKERHEEGWCGTWSSWRRKRTRLWHLGVSRHGMCLYWLIICMRWRSRAHGCNGVTLSLVAATRVLFNDVMPTLRALGLRLAGGLPLGKKGHPRVPVHFDGAGSAEWRVPRWR